MKKNFEALNEQFFGNQLKLDKYSLIPDHRTHGIEIRNSSLIYFQDFISEELKQIWTFFTLLKILILQNKDFFYPKAPDKILEAKVFYDWSREIIAVELRAPMDSISKVVEIDKKRIEQAEMFKGLGDGKSLLIKHTCGWLGDKINCLILISELRRKFPQSKIAVYLDSHPVPLHARYKGKDGIGRLFEDVADEIYLAGDSFKESSFDFSMEISSRDMDDVEIQDAQKDHVYITRARRWGQQIGISFTGEANAIYKVKETDGDRIKNDLKNLKRPLIGIAGFGSNRLKEWQPLENSDSQWQKVIDHLNALGCSVINIHYENLPLKNSLSFIDLSIRELGYLVSELDGLIAIEAGIGHFAGILKTPMVVLTGPSPGLILRHHSKKRIINKSICKPCFCYPQHFRFDSKHPCRDRDIPPFPCMEKITVQHIVENLIDLLRYEKWKVRKGKFVNERNDLILQRPLQFAK